MVRAHLSWNDLSSARSVLNRLIQKHPGEASTHLAAAYVALAEDRPADAARSALRAVNCDRFDVVVLATAAWLSYKGLHTEQAAEIADAALELAGPLPELVVDAAEYNLDMGRRGRAVELVKSSEFVPDSPTAVAAANVLLSCASYEIWERYQPADTLRLAPIYSSEGPKELTDLAVALAPESSDVRELAGQIMAGFRAADEKRALVVPVVVLGLVTTVLAATAAAVHAVSALPWVVAFACVAGAAALTAVLYFRAFRLPFGWKADIDWKFRFCDSFLSGALVFPVLLEVRRLRRGLAAGGYARVEAAPEEDAPSSP